MKVKISTKEKFHSILVNETILSANMTGELEGLLDRLVRTEEKNVVINLKEVKTIYPEIVSSFLKSVEYFKYNNATLVICEIQPELKKIIIGLEVTEELNITPTESEAWDIIQMDEIEREFM